MLAMRNKSIRNESKKKQNLVGAQSSRLKMQIESTSSSAIPSVPNYMLTNTCKVPNSTKSQTEFKREVYRDEIYAENAAMKEMFEKEFKAFLIRAKSKECDNTQDT